MAATGTNTKTTSPLHEILQWSTTRPEWQRDALRRIIEKGALDTTDIEELERISRRGLQNTAIKPVHLAVVPLAAMHLPAAPGASGSVSLLSMGDLQYVSRLPSGSKLPFGTGSGLAIIYGGNGAGKSSYARVIKKACRARGGAQDIMPNCFATGVNSNPASATIAFRMGTTEIQSSWINGNNADPRLSNVFVFDSFSAEHYLSNASEASFTPFGLDVLPKLSRACDELAARLKSDLANWNAKILGTQANWKYEPTTQAGKLIQGLNKNTKDTDVSRLATLDSTESVRLQTLRDALKSDPQQKARQTRATIARVEAFLQLLSSAVAALSDSAIGEIKKQIEYAHETTLAASAFASGQFDGSYLAGTGSALWRKLWDAAREYAVTPYSEGEYPATPEDARCVLCQQELDDSARKRFQRFDAFCKDTSQQLAASANQTLLLTSATFKKKSSLKPEYEKIRADVSILSAEQNGQLDAFIDEADARLERIKTNLESKQWSEESAILASPETVLRDAIKALETQALTEEAANDPVARMALESERKELEAREWLSAVKADELKQIGHFKIVAELEQCKKDLSTASITSKSSELTEVFVTAAFRDRFNKEAKALGLNTIQVVMEPVQGKKGITLFGLRLVNATNSSVAKIASEGEQRCVALAAFLAELSQATHQSALVFDDPVSSLDHEHRQRIAERLVEEAKIRQVIVFTHEVLFLNDLRTFAKNEKQTTLIQRVEWADSAPGHCEEGVPWDVKGPKECLDFLEKKQKSISNSWNPQPNETNRSDMRNAYSRLSSTLERIIENDLLGGVVMRFRSQIMSGQKLEGLVGIPASEIDELNRLLQKCHDLTDRHAPSSAAIPDSNQLLQDIDATKQLLEAIKTRRNPKKTGAP